MSLLNPGVLLVNLGTPVAPTIPAIRQYLAEFLNDPRVIDIPFWQRLILLYGIILPFRPAKILHAYQSIWTEQGSPLLVHGRALAEALQHTLQCPVALAMRYGEPELKCSLDSLLEQGITKLIVVPLFPQYANATNGSVLAAVMAHLKKRAAIPEVVLLGDFFADAGYINALSELYQDRLAGVSIDYMLFSYHGLPTRQLGKVGCKDSTTHCKTAPCPVIAQGNRYCYRAQCFATTKALVQAMDLQVPHEVVFQSRLGRTPWIEPYLDATLPRLYAKGVRKLAIASPSFVADCLETLEELAIRTREAWLELGGTEFYALPCLNSDARWVKVLGERVHRVMAKEF